MLLQNKQMCHRLSQEKGKILGDGHFIPCLLMLEHQDYVQNRNVFRHLNFCILEIGLGKDAKQAAAADSISRPNNHGSYPKPDKQKGISFLGSA